MSTDRHTHILLLISLCSLLPLPTTSLSTECLTINTRSPCTFPFTYLNTTYHTCTGAGHGIGRPWCSIQPTGVGVVGGEDSWGFCDVGCPTEPGCPSGWVRLSSGCYQFMEVEGGVEVDKAEYICQQFGAHLIDIMDVEEKWKVFKYFKEEVMNRKCFEHGKAFWIGNTYDRKQTGNRRPNIPVNTSHRKQTVNSEECLAWVADPYFSRDLVSDNYIITNVSCSKDTIKSNAKLPDIFVHPLCEKDTDIITTTADWNTTKNTRDEDITVGTEPSILKSVFTALFSLSTVLFKFGTFEHHRENCLPGFTKLSTGCYLFNKKHSNYQEASDLCKENETEMLKIDSVEELDVVSEYLEQIERSACDETYGWWIQDHDEQYDDTTKYSVIRGSVCAVAVFGHKITQVLFELQNDDLCNNRNLTLSGGSTTKYVLSNPACEQKKPASLEKLHGKVELSTLEHFGQFTKLFGNCFGDWVAIGTGCYQFVHLEKSVTQKEATNICQEKGGNLVEINTAKESEALSIYYMKNLITPPIKKFFHSFISGFATTQSKPTGWWTGASYNSSSDTWAWGEGGEEMEFAYWHENNRHAAQTENCAAVFDKKTPYQSLGWVSLPCEGRAGASAQGILLLPLCEKN